MKNSADLRGCYPPRPSASVDNTLLDLQNSSYPTQPVEEYNISHLALSWPIAFFLYFRAVIDFCNLWQLLWLNMLDLLLMLWFKLPVANRICPQSNRCFMAVKNKVTGDSKPYDRPVFLKQNDNKF